MKCIDVQWFHSKDDPIRLVSELGPDRFETRKIEFWADGRIGYASKDNASRDTMLGLAPVPSIEAINAMGEFSARELDAQSFEQLWARWVGRGLPLVECTVTFLTPAEGGRRVPFPSGALSGDTYRPHVVIGDPNQRDAVNDERAEEYIGVAFHDGPQHPLPGMEMPVVLTLMYYPHRMYEKLTPGTTFTLREGPLIAGHGRVQRWLD